MGTNSIVMEEEVLSWIQQLPLWQQRLASSILLQETISDSEIDEITRLYKSPPQAVMQPLVFPSLSANMSSGEHLRLVSVGDFSGIENLKPRKPLKFGTENLVVIYGTNGSGKSGYVRTLKAASGKLQISSLRDNVFDTPSNTRTCEVKYRINDDDFTHRWDIQLGSHISELKWLDIFDAEEGRAYISRETEISYSPQLLTLFEDLVTNCARVREKLRAEKSALVSKLPLLPDEYKDTDPARQYASLVDLGEERLSAFLTWSQSDESELVQAKERASLQDHEAMALRKKNISHQIQLLCTSVTEALFSLSKQVCEDVILQKLVAKEKRQIAQEGFKTIQATAPLDGVGGETWRQLWEAARRYSTETAYLEHPYPVTANGSFCVLCQQPLLEEGQQRLLDFEGYVKGQLEITASAAEFAYRNALSLMPVAPVIEQLQTLCQAAELSAGKSAFVQGFWNNVKPLQQVHH